MFVKKILPIFIVVFILLLFFYLDFVPGNKLEVNYDFCQKSRMLTELSPGNRVFPVVKDSGFCYQEIAGSPLYFDVRVPQYFKQAVVQVQFQNLAQEKLEFGVQTQKNEWLWMLKTIVPATENFNNQSWQTGQAEFDLTAVYQDSPVMRWIVSAPNLEKDQKTIKIKQIKIIFYKDKLNFGNVWFYLKSYAKKFNWFIK